MTDNPIDEPPKTEPSTEQTTDELIMTLKLILLDEYPCVNSSCWVAASRLQAYKDLVEKLEKEAEMRKTLERVLTATQSDLGKMVVNLETFGREGERRTDC